MGSYLSDHLLYEFVPSPRLVFRIFIIYVICTHDRISKALELGAILCHVPWLTATQTKSLSHTFIALFRGQLFDVYGSNLHWHIGFAASPLRTPLFSNCIPNLRLLAASTRSASFLIHPEFCILWYKALPICMV